MSDDTAASHIPLSLDSHKSLSIHPTDPSTSKQFSSRHSPVAPLAPLEYLQNQRRGSITDPSLHAASSNPPPGLGLNHGPSRQLERSSASSPAHNDPNAKKNPSDMRSPSSYVFGEATIHPTDNGHQHIRKLLRSPSTERDGLHSSSSLPHHDSQARLESASRATSGPSEPVGFEGKSK
jgi:hypothetical protein